MRQILININNTNTRIVAADSQGLAEPRTISTAELPVLLKTLPEIFDGRDQVVLASVVPEKTQEALEYIKLPVVRVGPDLDLPFDISQYPGVVTLGEDRIANAVYAAETGGRPAAIMDFGTAVTCDVLDEAGVYRGGVITPGLDVFTRYLHERTAQLPNVRFELPGTVFGKDTPSSMQSGCFYGMVGAVREILTEILRQGGWMEDALMRIAAGGYARIVADAMPGMFQRVEPLATLEGLRFIGLKNPAA